MSLTGFFSMAMAFEAHGYCSIHSHVFLYYVILWILFKENILMEIHIREKHILTSCLITFQEAIDFCQVGSH